MVDSAVEESSEPAVTFATQTPKASAPRSRKAATIADKAPREEVLLKALIREAAYATHYTTVKLHNKKQPYQISDRDLLASELAKLGMEHADVFLDGSGDLMVLKGGLDDRDDFNSKLDKKAKHLKAAARSGADTAAR